MTVAKQSTSLRLAASVLFVVRINANEKLKFINTLVKVFGDC
jgi:hypothetical protein